MTFAKEPPENHPVLDELPLDVLPPASELSWRSILDCNSKGVPHNNLDNVVRVLEHDPSLHDAIWYDEFLDAIVTTWQGPERKWRDHDDIRLQLYLQRHIGLTRVTSGMAHDAAVAGAFHNVKNECRTYLKTRQWDGVGRVNHVMHEAFGAADNAYSAAVGRCWFISMVARVIRPGCKVDTVPVLEGSQGVGKSSALAIIGGKWFVECHESVLTKDFFGVLDGHMLVEIAEMHSFTRSEVERVKGLISCQVDRYRKAYGRNTEDHPRQSVLACTTNRDDWQKDDTGARRFWPILCGAINLDWLRANRDQLFAEAVKLYEDGIGWWDVPIEDQKQEVEARRDVDSWEEIIEHWLIGRPPVSTGDILLECFKLEASKHESLLQRRVSRIMRVLGYKLVVTKDEARRSRRIWRKYA